MFELRERRAREYISRTEGAFFIGRPVPQVDQRRAPPGGFVGEAVVVGTDVWKTFGHGATEVNALRGVDVAIQRGEMLAIIGPSGCGKTTFLNCFSGLDDVSRGSVTFEGVDLRAMDDRRRSDYRARRVGFVFQSYNLLPLLTAEENVAIPLLIAGVGGREARDRARALLGELGLGARSTRPPSELSGGQQQRVSLARALVSHPAIVWADEPTGNLDEAATRQVTDLLRELNRAHQQTFVVVTHNPAVAAACDRTLRMEDGRFVP